MDAQANEVGTRRWAIALAVAGSVLVALAPLLFGGETFVARDHLSFSVPSRAVVAEALADGRIPAWWDGVGLGMPFAANPGHGVFYPLTWLGAALPQPFGVDALLALHLLILGLGVAAWSRRLGADESGAALAGVACVGAGYTASMLVSGIPLMTLAWTPWVAWAADRLARAGGRRAALTAAAAVAALYGVQILSGDPAGYLDSGLLAAIVVAARSDRGQRLTGLAWLAAAAVFAMALAAISLLPALAVLGESERAGGLSLADAGAWSMHPVRLLQWIWPDLLGAASDSTGDLAPIVADASAGQDLGPSWAMSVHVGAVVLALAATAFGARGAARRMAVASAVFVVLALGSYTPLYGFYRSVFVPERLIRYPEKHFAAALVIWCALAGVGLFQVRVDARARRVALAVLVAAAALLALGALGGVVARGGIMEWIDGHRASLAPALDSAAAAERVLAGALAALVVAGIGIAYLRVAARASAAARYAWAVVGAVAALGAWHTLALQPRIDRDLVTARPLALDVVPVPASDAERPRLYVPRGTALRTDARDPAALAALLHHTALENTATVFGFAYAPGYDPALSSRLRALWELAAKGQGGRLLSLFDIAFAVLPSPSVPGLRRLSPTPVAGMYVHEVTARRPRAFVSDRWQWLDSDSAVRETLFDPRRKDVRVLLTGHGEDAPEGDEGTIAPCAMERPRPERALLRCHASGPGVAVWLEAWAPGWRATVDGVAVPLLRADALVMAAAIPAGDHRIEFSYRAPGLRAGLAISALMVLLLAGVAIVARRR